MDTHIFNGIFNKFLSGGIDFSLTNLTYNDLYPCILFIEKFMTMPLVFSQPKVRSYKDTQRTYTSSKPM